jgi:hypothetical protein
MCYTVDFCCVVQNFNLFMLQNEFLPKLQGKENGQEGYKQICFVFLVNLRSKRFGNRDYQREDIGNVVFVLLILEMEVFVETLIYSRLWREQRKVHLLCFTSTDKCVLFYSCILHYK